VTPHNAHSDNGNAGLVEEPAVMEADNEPDPPLAVGPLPEFTTRTKQRTKPQIQQNRFVIIAAGAIVVALLIFVAISMLGRGSPQKANARRGLVTDQSSLQTLDAGDDKSLFPITDSGRLSAKESHQGFLNERDLERTVIRPASKTAQTGQTNVTGTLGSIQPWQAPPYLASTTGGINDPDKAEREAMEKSSLVYVQNASPTHNSPQSFNGAVPELGLGLPAGTRLRGRLDSAASTAVRTPVIAVIEYNYEHDGEMIVPAGAKAIGHIRDANRSGYVDIQFDSLLLPDGTSITVAAAATDLDLRPLKGKVEGKNTGKNVLVRSLSGIGQAGSLLLGQNSLNQPLSESDLVRERVSSNIGEAGDEEVSRLAINQQIVVSVSAGVPIYVVLEQAPKTNQGLPSTTPRNSPDANSAGADQLRQLLQLQKELSPSSTSN
jgi:hypothetical protein